MRYQERRQRRASWRFFLPALLFLLVALPAAASEGSSSTFLGIPVVLWKTLNMLVFFGLLFYLLAKPMSSFFRARREDIARRLAEAERQKAEAAQLRVDMEARLSRLSEEIEALQERLRQQGERDREGLERRGAEEGQRLLEQIEREATRRVAEARAQLAAEAANVAADLSLELLERELTPEDRRRIFERTLEHLQAEQEEGQR